MNKAPRPIILHIYRVVEFMQINAWLCAHVSQNKNENLCSPDISFTLDEKYVTATCCLLPFTFYRGNLSYLWNGGITSLNQLQIHYEIASMFLIYMGSSYFCFYILLVCSYMKTTKHNIKVGVKPPSLSFIFPLQNKELYRSSFTLSSRG